MIALVKKSKILKLFSKRSVIDRSSDSRLIASPTVNLAANSAANLAASLAVGLCVVGMTGCEYVTADGWVRQPLEGKLFTLDKGLDESIDPESTLIVSTTYLPVDNREDAKKLFDDDMKAIQEELDAGPQGLVAVALAQHMIASEYRTLTVWQSEDDMINFIINPAHLQAMNDAAQIERPQEAKVVHWEIKASELPISWDDAFARIESDGRRIGESSAAE